MALVERCRVLKSWARTRHTAVAASRLTHPTCRGATLIPLMHCATTFLSQLGTTPCRLVRSMCTHNGIKQIMRLVQLQVNYRAFWPSAICHTVREMHSPTS